MRNSTGKKLTFFGLALLLGLSVPFHLSADQDGPVLVQKEKSRVDDRFVPLTDVVSVENAGDSFQKLVSELYLGFSPAPDRIRKITRMEIKLELQKADLRAGDDFLLRGPRTTEVVRVQTPSTTPSDLSLITRVERRITSYIRNIPGYHHASIDVSVKEVEFGQAGLPEGPVEPVQVETTHPIGSGNIPFVVRVQKHSSSDDAQPANNRKDASKATPEKTGTDLSDLRNVNVLANVRLRAPVLVADRALKEGHSIHSHDVKRETLRIPAGMEPYVQKKQVTGRTAAVRVPDGDILNRSNVKSTTVVKQGDTVRFLLDTGGGKTHLQPHRVLEDGSVGDRIRVKGPGGQIRFGKVKNAHTVVAGDKNQQSSDRVNRNKEVTQ